MRFWTSVLDRTPYHHHQNINWVNIFWKISDKTSSKDPENCRIPGTLKVLLWLMVAPYKLCVLIFLLICQVRIYIVNRWHDVERGTEKKILDSLKPKPISMSHANAGMSFNTFKLIISPVHSHIAQNGEKKNAIRNESIVGTG